MTNLIIIIFLVISNCNKNVTKLTCNTKGKDDDLIYAAKKGNINEVIKLLNSGVNVNCKDKMGNTPLRKACKKGYIEIVKLLIEKGAKVNYTDKYRQETALLKACKKADVEIIKLLVEKGADVEDLTSDKTNSLILASKHGNLEIVKLLIEKGVNVNHANRDKKTALNEACVNGHTEIVKLLIEAGANVNYIDKYKNIPLITACQKGYVEIVKLLIENGADINYTGKDIYNMVGSELTPLIICCKKDNIEIVKLLIEKGADINKKVGKYSTPFLNAKLQMKKLLINEGVQINKDNENAIKIIEEMLFENIKENKIDGFLNLINKFKNLINLNTKDSQGNSFVHYICLLGNEFLLNTIDFDPNILNNKGESPLYYALSNNLKKEFIYSLIEKGARLQPNSYINDKALCDYLTSYPELLNKLVINPLSSKLSHDIYLKDKEILKELILTLKLKEDDFINEIKMIKFIKNILDNKDFILNMNGIKINENNQDIELNIGVFDEIFNYFKEEDFWPSIKQKGINEVKKNFKKKLKIIETYIPVNKSLLIMNSEERLQHTNFQRKKKLAHLLRLISKTAINGYNNDKIKFAINQILDVVACSEGTLEAVNDAVRYLSGEDDNELKDIINEELMQFRYNILKEVSRDKIKIKVNGREEKAELTPHIFPQLVRDMHDELKLKIEYLDEDELPLVYNKSHIINEVSKIYKERIIDYTRDKIEENRVLWNKARDYIERDVFKGRAILQIDNFIYSDVDYKIKKEAIKALLIHLGYLNKS